jgi:TPR repeat protein
LKLAASNGHPDAAALLGKFYAEGRMCKANPAEAFRLFSDASNWSSTEGTFSLAQCYAHGFGVKANIEEATRFYLRIADRHAEAALALADCYEQGKGVEASKEKAEHHRAVAAALQK